MRRYAWLRRYSDYLQSFLPSSKIGETKEKELTFAHGVHQGRASGASTFLPIWANGSFEPVRISLVTGETDLLSAMNIIKKLDIAV